jgi:two-component system NtrC family sensor kinase
MSTENMSSAPTRRSRILVVDDEPLVTMLIAEALALEGHDVDTARDGQEALDRVSACAYDAILSDLRMPGLDGVGLYRGLDQHHPSLLRRIAFVSGTTQPVEYASFLEETGVTVLRKPFAIDDLQQLVQRLLQEGR